VIRAFKPDRPDIMVELAQQVTVEVGGVMSDE
jgi:hypothetical protein